MQQWMDSDFFGKLFFHVCLSCRSMFVTVAFGLVLSGYIISTTSRAFARFVEAFGATNVIEMLVPMQIHQPTGSGHRGAAFEMDLARVRRLKWLKLPIGFDQCAFYSRWQSLSIFP
uniref:ABC transmembrane type-1 domain-containing protein n=1 Tax=Panagrellus redivivus TaxID=6233 RepID=A0A7E4VLX5_PANRE